MKEFEQHSNLPQPMLLVFIRQRILLLCLHLMACRIEQKAAEIFEISDACTCWHLLYKCKTKEDIDNAALKAQFLQHIKHNYKPKKNILLSKTERYNKVIKLCEKGADICLGSGTREFDERLDMLNFLFVFWAKGKYVNITEIDGNCGEQNEINDEIVADVIWLHGLNAQM